MEVWSIGDGFMYSDMDMGLQSAVSVEVRLKNGVRRYAYRIKPAHDTKQFWQAVAKLLEWRESVLLEN